MEIKHGDYTYRPRLTFENYMCIEKEIGILNLFEKWYEHRMKTWVNIVSMAFEEYNLVEDEILDVCDTIGFIPNFVYDLCKDDIFSDRVSVNIENGENKYSYKLNCKTFILLLEQVSKQKGITEDEFYKSTPTEIYKILGKDI